MLKILPILLTVLYALLMYRFSVGRTRRMLDAQSQPLTDPSILRLSQRMAEALELPQIRVLVYEIEAVNGLADADGRIFLTRGFLNRKARGEVTAEELASVMVFAVLRTLLMRFIPFIGAWIALMISNALMAGLSRRDEFEADAYAAALLIKSGIGTAPQIALFRKLAGLGAAGGQGVPAWLLSHPRIEQRIAAIEAAEGRWTAP
jgi:putative metalloprotease